MAVERRMVESLRTLSKDSVVDYQNRIRHEWVLDHPGQIIILTSQIEWCKGTEIALDGHVVSSSASPLLGVHMSTKTPGFLQLGERPPNCSLCYDFRTTRQVPGKSVDGIKTWYVQTCEYLVHMINLVRGELTKLQRGAMVALITIDVHNRDIIEYLIEDGTDNKFDFNWQMRIRYYWDDSLFAPLGDCKIRQV
jgi:dynein heavy chain